MPKSRPARRDHAYRTIDTQEPYIRNRPEKPQSPSAKGMADRLWRPTKFRPRTEGQARLVEGIEANTILFIEGPAGTGKTRAVVAKASEALDAGEVKSIVLLRPCVGVGPTSGFLPGDLKAKVSVYLRPLLDELREFYPADKLNEMIEDETIELTSLEYSRGRTMKKAYVILDEAQNATYKDLKMLLTRLGEGSKMLINGDLSRDCDGMLKQCDLHPSQHGAFEAYSERFLYLDGIGKVKLDERDIVRHPLVRAMVAGGL